MNLCAFGGFRYGVKVLVIGACGVVEKGSLSEFAVGGRKATAQPCTLEPLLAKVSWQRSLGCTIIRLLHSCPTSGPCHDAEVGWTFVFDPGPSHFNRRFKQWPPCQRTSRCRSHIKTTNLQFSIHYLDLKRNRNLRDVFNSQSRSPYAT